ncbi:DNA alkylation repair protein [Methanolobus sp. WCC5]|jgi:3-methyladenine DNA glycosylase AlkD|uniref:DNA alkylation repair protein n=1 Tax=Methanolobus sp. WCC5 TaxID=3125785 RepID=UPI0032482362
MVLSFSEIYSDIIHELESNSRPEAIEGMARYGITPKKAYGVSIPVLRRIAKGLGRNHELALKLWEGDIRETRILAGMVDDVSQVTGEQMDEWVQEFDYWEICDQCCMNLFEDHPLAYDKAMEWSRRDEELVKRAGYVMMARLAVSDKKADDAQFEQFFPLIINGSDDPRNYVKKAVNWALRQIGKRNLALNARAMALCEELLDGSSGSARWIAADALRELRSEKVLEKLEKARK